MKGKDHKHLCACVFSKRFAGKGTAPGRKPGSEPDFQPELEAEEISEGEQ